MAKSSKGKLLSKPSVKSKDFPQNGNQKPSSKKNLKTLKNSDQLKCTPREAAFRAGLVWPLGPYSQLGKVYCQELKDKLKEAPNFTAITSFPRTEKEMRKVCKIKKVGKGFSLLGYSTKGGSRNFTKSSKTLLIKIPKALFNSSGRWLLYLSERLKQRKSEEKIEATYKTLCKVEKELRKHGSSLDEIIFFDPLYEILVAKGWLDAIEQQDASERKFQTEQRRRLSSQIKGLEKVKSHLEEKAKETPRFKIEAKWIGKGLAYIQAAQDTLNPMFSTSPKIRRTQLEKHYGQRFSWRPGLKIYHYPEIFKDVIVVATDIMKIRRFQKKVIDSILAEIMPNLFPEFLFPEQPYPIVSTPSTVQKIRSRRKKPQA